MTTLEEDLQSLLDTLPDASPEKELALNIYDGVTNLRIELQESQNLEKSLAKQLQRERVSKEELDATWRENAGFNEARIATLEQEKGDVATELLAAQVAVTEMTAQVAEVTSVDA